MSIEHLSQTQRVLRLLRQRGDQGVTAVDFALPNVVDGGKPIMRLAARIKDLRDDGVTVLDGGRRGPVAVYVLVPEQRPVTAAAPAAPATPPRPAPHEQAPVTHSHDGGLHLFDPGPDRARGHYGQDVAA